MIDVFCNARHKQKINFIGKHRGDFMEKYEKIQFGNYMDSPIIWRVLRKDNNSIFMLSEYALDNRCFNDEYTNITWEDCSLRKWLNNEFLSESFSGHERDLILPTKHGENGYIDFVFCLNIGECLKYLPNPEDRVCYISEYLKSKSEHKWSYKDNRCIWWLRSMAYHFSSAIYVEYDGWLNPYSNECIGNDVDDWRMLVRPAIIIKNNIDSDKN
jgi:hypothetical protein